MLRWVSMAPLGTPVVPPVYCRNAKHHQLDDSGAEAIVVLENFAQTLEKAIDGTRLRVVLISGAGDLLGGPRGLLVNFVLRYVRRAVPPWRLPQAVRLNRALSLGRASRRSSSRRSSRTTSAATYSATSPVTPNGFPVSR
jgi:long-chain acyl-CoA synthetase